MLFVDVGLEIITMVEGQRANGAREVHRAVLPWAARVEVHAIDVLLQTIGVQVHVIAERTPHVGVGVQFPALGRRTDARRRARGRRVHVPLGYVVRQLVLGQKRLAAYLAHRLRPRRRHRPESDGSLARSPARTYTGNERPVASDGGKHGRVCVRGHGGKTGTRKRNGPEGGN